MSDNMRADPRVQTAVPQPSLQPLLNSPDTQPSAITVQENWCAVPLRRPPSGCFQVFLKTGRGFLPQRDDPCFAPFAPDPDKLSFLVPVSRIHPGQFTYPDPR